MLYMKSYFIIQRLRSHGTPDCKKWRQHVCIFTRNPRGGNAKAIDPADVAKFQEIAREHEFGKIVAHAPYTLNACAAKKKICGILPEILFSDDLKRMEATPGNYYNFHPGSHLGQGIEVGIQKIAEVLNAVLTEEQTTTVLLETMAGKGSEVGSHFQELRAIMDLVEKNAINLESAWIPAMCGWWLRYCKRPGRCLN